MGSLRLRRARRRGAGHLQVPALDGGDGCNVSSYGFVTTVEEGLQFYIASNGRYIVSPATPRAIWDGKWHHIAGTFDGRAVRFYVDGKQVGNGSAVPAGTTIDYSLETTSGTIGGYAGECPGRQLNLRGDVDGVQVWSTPIQVDTVWAILKSVVSLAR